MVHGDGPGVLQSHSFPELTFEMRGPSNAHKMVFQELLIDASKCDEETVLNFREYACSMYFRPLLESLTLRAAASVRDPKRWEIGLLRFSLWAVLF